MLENRQPGQDGCWLSVVVIGRNEGRTLPGLFKSLPAVPGVETIYVDSCSTDRSVQIALEHGARVFCLDPDSVCGPATGRHVGTREARGRWVLYLDGDMTLHPGFIPFLLRLKEEPELPAGTAGFVGRTRNHFLDPEGRTVAVRDYVCLTPRQMGQVEDWGRVAEYHGGAVLYRRESVLAAGNWNPAVLQLEEIDLYSRIRGRGGHVRAVDLPMAEHYTPFLTVSEKLKLNFLPQWRGKKLYGAGQVLAARWRQRQLLNFFRYYPYPFLIFAALVTIPLQVWVWTPLPLLVNGGLALWLAVTKRWYYYLVYLGNILQSIRGVFRYRPFVPAYRPVFNHTTDYHEERLEKWKD